MHRLGHLPATVALSAAASASSVSLPASTLGTAPLLSLGSSDNPWQILHVYVLPLFNGEPLSMPIEDLNQLVRRHIQGVISRGFSRAIAALETDVKELIATGMLTLNTKLQHLDDERLLPRLVDIWVNFFDQILPYIEGVLLPVHTDKLLLGLHRSKPTRPTSPSLAETSPSMSSMHQIDVRRIALLSFRDSIILPIHDRLLSRIGTPTTDSFSDGADQHQPRLQQMLLVLSSSVQHTTSIPGFTITPGEDAVTSLLRAVRKPRHPHLQAHTSITRLPSFLSGGGPRDRRGRIARKSLHIRSATNDTIMDDLNGNGGNASGSGGIGDETPRSGMDSFARRREREWLASLRSVRSAYLFLVLSSLVRSSFALVVSASAYFHVFSRSLITHPRSVVSLALLDYALCCMFDFSHVYA
ncbi:HbrB-domain-containing protein [Sistotremastrum suecicum HHB10207 ss-3]|uniref:HbrB-domain-containing protein n=1 Tax=Sistotremastrum suecicum HHB10207 ss-3 TaxID=1314776 RepID=A0A166G998_9AGAM|nr:HbrB-domain-containing protein [Sistotremastrum suecicum HHB10207 ss-3]